MPTTLNKATSNMSMTELLTSSSDKPHAKLVQTPYVRHLVLSTPRTGSVLVSELLYHQYRKENMRIQHLGEFLNPYHFNLYFEDLHDGTKINHLEAGPNRYMSIPALDKNGRICWGKFYVNEKIDREQEIARRLDILKKSTTSHVLHHHIFTTELAKEVIACGFDFIVVCRRRDIWQQILSYGVAFATKRFRHVEGSVLDLPIKTITFPKATFDTLVYRIKEMDKFLSSDTPTPSVHTLFYEDILELGDTSQILDTLGIKNKKEKDPAKQPKVSIKTPYKLPIEMYYTPQALGELKQWFDAEFPDNREG